MATEAPLFKDGSQNVLSTTQDARRSSITGSTLPGPNGSGQFLFVTNSTTVDRTVTIASTAPTTTPASVYGVLQNTPSGGLAADVALLGITKVVAGSTGFVRGGLISASSTSGGTATAWATGQVYLPAGIALETPTAVGAIISALVWPYQRGATSS